MKKCLLSAAALACSAIASAQVMDKAGFQNTLWLGAGSPLVSDFRFYGLIDTLQGRVDQGDFTLDGMINWGALAYGDKDDVDYFIFGNTDSNPLQQHYEANGWHKNEDYHHYWNTNRWRSELGLNNGVYVASSTLMDSYYVNFIYHPTKEFDIGIGTQLNWEVGPAPSYGGWLWEADAHCRQGGFSTSYDDRSGSAGWDKRNKTFDNGTYYYSSYKPGNRPGTADVVGFVPYANRVAKTALAAKFETEGNIGVKAIVAIPTGVNTDDFCFNAGVQVSPAKWLSLAAAYEGLLNKYGNFYAGATIDLDKFILDLYLGIDGIGGDWYYYEGKHGDDGAVATGAAITLKLFNTLTLRPEIGVNFFEDSHFTPAGYLGVMLGLDITKQFSFGCWGSAAIGSKDKRWDDKEWKDATNGDSEDWTGGHVLNLRPQITFNLSDVNTFSAYVNLENRNAFDDKVRNCWSTGLFWRHIFK